MASRRSSSFQCSGFHQQILNHIPLPGGSIFEEARERVSREVDSIVSCLHQKRDRMLEEIGGLEREFEGRQREKQKDISKLNTLIAHTEELGRNSLLGFQQRMIGEMQQEVEKLQGESRQPPEYQIDIRWGEGLTRDQFIESINKSSINKANNSCSVQIGASGLLRYSTALLSGSDSD